MDIQSENELPEIVYSHIEHQRCASPARFASADEALYEKFDKSPSRDSFDLNTTQDSGNDEFPCKFGMLSPSKYQIELSDASEDEIDEQEDLDVSLSSLGLDFV